MAKASIYKELFATKSIVINEFTTHSENKPYSLNMFKTFNSPELFDNITLLIENSIKTKTLEFDKICAVSASALPYATNVATSFEKPFCYVQNTGNDTGDKQNIKNIKIEGGMEIDERILLIETVCNNDFYIENIMARIRKYGGTVVGIIIIVNICEGEYVNLLAEKENIIAVINLFDIFTHLENNNMIEMFYSEKIKFYCEKETKLNIKKLLSDTQQETTYETSASS
jgi:orotate phosphoribosyltransferase